MDMDQMKIKKKMELTHTIKIKTTSERIWDFLTHIEKNYKAWHPKDHIKFIWTKGEPFSEGSTFYAEQYMMDHIVKYKGWIAESVPKKKITMRFHFPMSIVTDKIEMILEDTISYATFTHITYLKFKPLSRTLFKQRNLKMIQDINEHVANEANNMKNILEGKQT